MLDFEPDLVARFQAANSKEYFPMAVGKEGEDDRAHCSANIEGIILRRKLEMREKQDFLLLVMG